MKTVVCWKLSSTNKLMIIINELFKQELKSREYFTSATKAFHL